MSEARTWKCPECGHTEEINYDWLAEHGGPVCEHCDCDMQLQPETGAPVDDRAAVVQRLVEKATANSLKAEDFDETVHELAASIAADVNNEGLERQLGYLIDQLGSQETGKQLDRLAEERSETTNHE